MLYKQIAEIWQVALKMLFASQKYSDPKNKGKEKIQKQISSSFLLKLSPRVHRAVCALG